ncbi:MAG: hypothetical protein AAGI01_18765, partial [Myxococcota bacterium]
MPRWMALALCFALTLLAAPTALAQDEGADEDLDELDEDEDELSRIDTIDVIQKPNEIAKTGSSAQTLDEEDLEAFEYDNPEDVLRQLPSVFVRPEDGFGLRPNIG